jgi:hypothetical protein
MEPARMLILQGARMKLAHNAFSADGGVYPDTNPDFLYAALDTTA